VLVAFMSFYKYKSNRMSNDQQNQTMPTKQYDPREFNNDKELNYVMRQWGWGRFKREDGTVTNVEHPHFRIIKEMYKMGVIEDNGTHPLSQWAKHSTYYEEDGQVNCLCGKHHIKNIARVKNVYNGYVCDRIGSTCIQAAFDYNGVRKDVEESMIELKAQMYADKRALHGKCIVPDCTKNISPAMLDGLMCGHCHSGGRTRCNRLREEESGKVVSELVKEDIESWKSLYKSAAMIALEECPVINSPAHADDRYNKRTTAYVLHELYRAKKLTREQVPPLDWDECPLSHWVPGWGDDVQEFLDELTPEEMLCLPYSDFLEDLEPSVMLAIQ
jgi:hypothetical protein